MQDVKLVFFKAASLYGSDCWEVWSRSVFSICIRQGLSATHFPCVTFKSYTFLFVDTIIFISVLLSFSFFFLFFLLLFFRWPCFLFFFQRWSMGDSKGSFVCSSDSWFYTYLTKAGPYWSHLAEALPRFLFREAFTCLNDVLTLSRNSKRPGAYLLR